MNNLTLRKLHIKFQNKMRINMIELFNFVITFEEYEIFKSVKEKLVILELCLEIIIEYSIRFNILLNYNKSLNLIKLGTDEQAVIINCNA